MPSPFNITTPTSNIVLNNRRGTATFTVALAARRKTRASARMIMSPEAATPAWLTLVLPEGGTTPDDPIREFNLNDSKQYQVKIEPPDTLGPASFTFRLVVADEVDPEENFSESSEVSFTVPEPVKQPSTPIGLIIAIVVGVLLVIGIIAGVIITSNQRNTNATATSVASNLTSQANQTATEVDAQTRTVQVRQTATAAVQQTASVQTATANAQATQTAAAQQTAGAQTAIANTQATQTAAAARADFVITDASSAVCSIIQNFPVPIHDVGAVFQVANSGTIPLQSVSFEVQVPPGTVINVITLNAPFGNLFDPCVTSRGRTLAPGESGSLQVKQRVNGFVSDGLVRIKLCSQPNLQGLCQEQTRDFSF